MNASQITKRISKIKKELDGITSMRKGSISQQYNVCGSPGCKCKDPVSPQKHGPYNKLRIYNKGKGTTKFIKDEDLDKVEGQLKTYKEFDQLISEWVSLANQLADLEINSKSK